jgi:hypothetical protein
MLAEVLKRTPRYGRATKHAEFIDSVGQTVLAVLALALAKGSRDLRQHRRCASGVPGAEKLLIHDAKSEESNKHGYCNSHECKRADQIFRSG